MRRPLLLTVAAAILATLLFVPVSQAAPARPYVVSIGDSVAAGTGLPAANGEQNQLCRRSKQSYPYIVAQGLGASQLLHIPCNGAKIDDGVYGQQVIGATAKSPQLERAFKYGQPDVILATVGANDMRWRYFAGKCYYQVCGTSSDRTSANAYLGDLYYELIRMLNEINTRSTGTLPRVMISGYYHPLEDTSCISSSAITATEQQWLDSQVVRLNDSIRRVANLYSNVEFVPLDFTGHGICSSDPWVQPLSRTGTGALHPTATGQQAIAGAFLRQNID